jgi:hypothetical protein
MICSAWLLLVRITSCLKASSSALSDEAAAGGSAAGGAGAGAGAAVEAAAGAGDGARAGEAAVRPGLACVNDVMRGRAQSVVVVMATAAVSLTRTCRAAASNAETAAAAAAAAASISPGLAGGDALTGVEAPEVSYADFTFVLRMNSLSSKLGWVGLGWVVP